MADQGKILKEYVNSKGLNKTKLAADLGMTTQNLYQLFISKDFKPDTVSKIEKALKIKWNELEGVNIGSNILNEPKQPTYTAGSIADLIVVAQKSQVLYETNKTLADANKELSESNRKLADAHLILAEGNRELIQLIKGMVDKGVSSPETPQMLPVSGPEENKVSPGFQKMQGRSQKTGPRPGK